MTNTDVQGGQAAAQMFAGEIAQRGGISRLRLPGGVGHQALDEALANYNRLAAEHKQTNTELQTVEGERRRAVDADKAAFAKALAAGSGKDPGQPLTKAADERAADVRRRRDALAAAVGLAATRIGELVVEHRQALTDRLAAELVDQAAEVASAAEVLAAAVSRHAETSSRLRWVTRYPDGFTVTGPALVGSQAPTAVPALGAARAIAATYAPPALVPQGGVYDARMSDALVR